MFDPTLLILLGLAALGFVSHNTTVAISILVLIIVRVTPLSGFFPWIEKQGLTVGIIILTIGVMAPIASGTLPASTLIHAFMNWKSLIAIAVGVFVSWLGGRGVTLMRLPSGWYRCLSVSRSQAGDIPRRSLPQPLFEHGDKRRGGVITQSMGHLLHRLAADQSLQGHNKLELMSPAAKAEPGFTDHQPGKVALAHCKMVRPLV